MWAGTTNTGRTLNQQGSYLMQANIDDCNSALCWSTNQESSVASAPRLPVPTELLEGQLAADADLAANIVSEFFLSVSFPPEVEQ